MNRRQTLKMIHLAGTVWFMLCVGFLVVLALRQAGFNWWVIFSLSGHSALIIFLLISLYLFAIFGAAGKEQKIALEHPLTSTGPYLAFYVSAPLLGTFAGAVAVTGQTTVVQLIDAVTLGTIGTTFLTWVIVDPLLSVLEILTPQGKARRAGRLAEAKALREKRQQNRRELLARVLAQQEQDRVAWQSLLTAEAEILAALLKTNNSDLKCAERRAVDLGVRAWQIGGLNCMRLLRNIAMQSYRKKNKSVCADYISYWWDGIGNWRSPAVG